MKFLSDTEIRLDCVSYLRLCVYALWLMRI